ncbi:MAG TPA: LEA type 2 family protein [Gammaproteobacteria bacterium]|nr:LEA type 2 family protein [Gammaproteobacteria bacterium]
MLRRSFCLLAAVGITGVAACSSLPRQLVPPRVELVELRLLQASFDGQRFAVRVELDNPNAVPIPVRQIEFDVRLAGEGLLDGRSVAPFTLPAGGRQTVDIEIFSNLVSSATRLLALVQGPQNTLEYELQGELTLDVSLREPLGFYHRGQVPLVLPL